MAATSLSEPALRVWMGLGIAVCWGTGCRDMPPLEPGPLPPEVGTVVAQANSLSTLSAAVTFEAHHVDSARVTCRPASGGLAASTPYYALADGPARIVALGLWPSTSYRCAVAALGRGGAATSDSVGFQTPDLPASLAGMRLEITGSRFPDYVITEVTGSGSAFAVAFDSTGSVRWYRAFPAEVGEAALDVEQQPNGNFTLYVGASTGWQPVDGNYFEFRPDGELVGTYTAGAPYYTDPHDLRLSPTAGTTVAYLFGYDLRTVDLTTLGGRADQLVAGHVLVRRSGAGPGQILWDAWDHFTIADWVFVPPNLSAYPTIDFDHPNSLAIDPDGNYVVSFAMPGEVTTIDAATGQLLWRLGGRHNQFTIAGDPLQGFGFQHDVHVLDNGNLLLYDNGLRHTPPQSRAVEYRLDTGMMTATLAWEYRHDPPVFTPFVGSVQRLRNGNTMIGYGAASFMTEVTPGGQVVWEGRLSVNGQPVPYFYRARRIPSLYRYLRP